MKNKKEQPEQQEKTLVIDITPTRGLLALLALVLVTAACLGYLAWGQKEAAASAPAAPAAFTGMRKYYMTQSNFVGNAALTACASGYHMASLWEILDPSNLEYNSDLGFARDDDGAGPPTHRAAWVRTGWDSESNSGYAGQENCAVWTTNSGSAWGTVAYFSNDWTGDFEDLHVWDVTRHTCDTGRRVWCVED